MSHAGQGYLWMCHRDPSSPTWDLAVRGKQLWQDLAAGSSRLAEAMQWQVGLRKHLNSKHPCLTPLLKQYWLFLSSRLYGAAQRGEKGNTKYPPFHKAILSLESVQLPRLSLVPTSV